MISVIVPCYNARAWIEQTISSVLQSAMNSTEVLVIDDGSSDGSGEYVRKLFPGVQVVTTPNRGVSEARNLGSRLARGDYLLFLDADDLLTPGAIARQLAAIEATRADFVYSNWQRLRQGPDGAFVPAEIVRRTLSERPEIDYFLDFWCPTGAYLFRREMIEKVGGFSPRLPVIQDARLPLDCLLHGATFAHVPDVACLYRTHQGGSLSTRSQEAFWRDVFVNACEVRDWWATQGALDSVHKAAVINVLDNVVRVSCRHFPALFDLACNEIDTLLSESRAPGRWPTQLAIRALGYRQARQLLGKARRWGASQDSHIAEKLHTD